MEYLLKSVLCLLLLLLFYRLFLQQEVLHRFNRFYLLAAVLGSFLIPLITFEVKNEISPTPLSEFVFPAEVPSMDLPTALTSTETSPIASSPNAEIPWAWIVWTFYLSGVLVFLIRFLRNIRIIRDQIRQNIQVIYKEETLVLLDRETSPFSFLSYIFYSRSNYEKDGIPEAVFLHEQCHVREKHSWDILLLELLLIPFWFHPGLYFARQAIRLNHEFIADQQVISKLPVRDYQNLLLAVLTYQPVGFGSSLNFSLTKKRFTMMKKTTSNTKKWAVIGLSISLVLFSGFLFSTKVAVDKVEQDLTNQGSRKVQVLTASSQNLTTYLALYGKYQTQVNENRLFSNFTQEEMMRLEGEFRLLDLSFARLSLEERRQVKRASFPFAKITQDGKVTYKKIEDLTEEERKNMAC